MLTNDDLRNGAIVATELTELMNRTGPDADGRFRLRVPMGRHDCEPLASVKIELDVEPSEIQANREWCEHAARVVRTIRAVVADDKLLDLCEPDALFCTWCGLGVDVDLQGEGIEITNLDTAYADVVGMLRKYAARCIAAADRLEAV